MSNSPNTLGTTPFIKIPKADVGTTSNSGEVYFQVKIHAAQAALFSSFLESPKQLVVTSEVRMNCPPFGDEPLKSIRQIRSLKRGTAQQLGLATTLIALTPGTMDRVSIAIEYLLDQQNRIEAMAELVNDDAFLSVISLAPGTAAVTKSIGMLSKKIVDTFLDDTDRQPVLRFVGDFGLRNGELSDSYYVILGSRYDKYPLPRPLPTPAQLRIDGSDLLFENQPVTQWSYVILDVDTVEYRTRQQGRYEPWHKKLDQAEVEANRIQNDPFAKDKDRRDTWKKCQALIQEADTLLRTDPLYLPSEVESIIQQAYQTIQGKVLAKPAGLGAPPELSLEERSFLRVASGRDLATKVAEYSAGEIRSETKLKALRIIS